MTKPTEQSMFDMQPDAAWEARQDALAEADYAAGRVVPHEKAVEWLNSLGTPHEPPKNLQNLEFIPLM